MFDFFDERDQWFGGSASTDAMARGAGRARRWLKGNNLPYSDEIPLQSSGAEFAEGGHYGVEIPVVNSFKVLEATIALIKQEGLPVTRFNETLGAFLLSDAEVKEMLAICRENGIGMVFSLGPRPEYDRKAAFYRGNFGLSQGRRVNNNDALAVSVEEALRLSELGCRGLIVYDLGVLRLLSRMKQEGILPQDVMIKTSSHCIVSNPMTSAVYAETGANSVTVTHDVGLPVLQEMRKATKDLVLDIPTDVYGSKGGFIRFYEIPELVQIASPVFLKMGASAQAHPHDPVSQSTIQQRVQRVALGLEHLQRAGMPFKYINNASPHYCIPRKV